MKIGFSLGRRMLNEDGLCFARQAGATHIHLNLTDPLPDTPTAHALRQRFPHTASSEPDETLWTYESFRDLRRTVEAMDMELDALTMFEPAHWSDVLLDGPKRAEQMENLKRILRDMGRAGIPTMGYNFTIAGVWGRNSTQTSRGGAPSPGFHDPPQPPIPAGMVWNRVYDVELYDADNPKGYSGQITHEELWQRLERFLLEILPVAEASGVTLAPAPR